MSLSSRSRHHRSRWGCRSVKVLRPRRRSSTGTLRTGVKLYCDVLSRLRCLSSVSEEAEKKQSHLLPCFYRALVPAPLVTPLLTFAQKVKSHRNTGPGLDAVVQFALVASSDTLGPGVEGGGGEGAGSNEARGSTSSERVASFVRLRFYSPSRSQTQSSPEKK